MINYSIIIPHKNSIDLLKRCLSSIPKRDDLEVIVVDDNSDPDKVNFINFPGLNDKNTKVIFTKDGKGAGYARNKGLEKASGKWILFSDADDYFCDNILNITDKYIDSDFDLIYFRVYTIKTIKGVKNTIDSKYDKLMINAINNNDYDTYKYTAMMPWGKMVKLSLIKENNILFDETGVANDRYFSFLTAYNAKNIHFDTNRIYTHISDHGFLRKNKSLQSNYDRFYVYIRVNYFLKTINKESYKTNLILPLFHLIKINNMNYFFSAFKLFKEYHFSVFLETINFLINLPLYIINKNKKNRFIFN